ncbi:MAG: LysM domain-containing protein [Candidatus Doudnabacteria bacterium]
MNFSSKKIKLSPRLNMGVGRNKSRYSFYNIGGSILIIASIVLTVRAGYMLFQKNNSSSNPQVLGAVDTETSQESQATQSYQTYQVESGDTLFTISQKFDIDWTVIATLNKIDPPFNLKLNQDLKIPKK